MCTLSTPRCARGDTQVLRWQTGTEAHAAGTHPVGGHRCPLPARLPRLQVNELPTTAARRAHAAREGSEPHGVVSSAIPQHVCASVVVSLFQGCMETCRLLLQCPCCCGERPLFSNTTATKRISHVTCRARPCKCYQLLPASLLIAFIPGFIPVGCSGQLKRRRKGLEWELQAWMEASNSL